MTEHHLKIITTTKTIKVGSLLGLVYNDFITSSHHVDADEAGGAWPTTALGRHPVATRSEGQSNLIQVPMLISININK
jgi:hypothetical protein